jgi:tRNA pseudouridine55 synthase
MDRIFAAYKPLGMTSHDVVARIRKLLQRGTKVGHAGTLDPLAEGVLVIAVGPATKRISEEVAKEKEYVATIKLGEDSTTDDAEGEKTVHAVVSLPVQTDVERALKAFVGTIQQVPPIYSALKLQGRPAYERARRGEAPVMEARTVVVHSAELLEYAWPLLKLHLVTGPGVYVRSIARDLGAALKTGGHLIHLLRTRVGEYDIEQAVRLEDMEKYLATP